MKISIHFSSFLTTLFLYSLISSAIHDTINTANIIRDGETLVSSGQSFELGFFSPGNSTNRYVGIWYKKITAQTVIWVANRESPLTTNSTYLTVDQSGQLVIRDQSNNNTIWRSSNSSRVALNPVVQLLDSGNLVIREANDDRPENYMWQSFDYPTDTFLPGMDFGWNHATGTENYLSSWRSNDDPAPGDFTLGFDMTGYPQLFIKRGGVVVYRLGPWNVITFSQKGDPIVKVGTFRNNSNSVIYYRDESTNESVFSRLTLGSVGVSQRWRWNDRSNQWVYSFSFPADICDNYGSCGAHGLCNADKLPNCVCFDKFKPQDERSWAIFDWSGGCVRRNALNCRDDVFMKYSGLKLPDSRGAWFNASLSMKECEAVCSRNCSCTAYTNMSGCLLWFGELFDMRVLPGAPHKIYIRFSASELENIVAIYNVLNVAVLSNSSMEFARSGPKGVVSTITISVKYIYIGLNSSPNDSHRMKRATLIVILTSLAGILLLGLSVALFVLKTKINNNNQKMRNKESLEQSNDEELEMSIYDWSIDEDLEMHMYDFSIVTKATNNFSDNNKIGEGGFGPVYKGILEDGKEIAAKRLSKTSSQGLDEFKNEVICIAKLQHRNLMKLLGCCIQGEEKILIYEYMPNKSLDFFLFDKMRGGQLDWPKRFIIINGISRGLLYLHQDSRLRIIHRDIKASNVLLDKDLIPKISDFGLARVFGGNETEANTKRVVGTYGYMSPEYAGYGLFSLKSDVYSFGVLVLEILSGQRCGDLQLHHTDHHHDLLGRAWILYKEGRPLELVDPNIVNYVHVYEMERYFHVALLCVQQHPEDRPTMSSVVLMLGSGGVLPEARQPGFFTSSKTNAISLRPSNKYTITQLEGR